MQTNNIKEVKSIPSTLLCDFYKLSHREQYPKGTEMIYSTWIPRASRKEGIDKVVAFGFQGFIKKYLINYFNENFFNRNTEEVVDEYKRVIKYTLGIENPKADHIEALHKLGYLPIKIKAVKEGTLIPLRIPMLTIENTKSEFFWITNYLETLMSAELWMSATSATLALEYRKILESYAKLTNGDTSGVQFQGHDFSMRGMSCVEASGTSGAGHLLSFVGTDTIPAIIYHENYYNADIEKELVGTSISATEHSCMCCHGENNELETYKYLIEDVYPSGFVSIVSDTWDLWKVLSDVIAPLKSSIMARDGRVVVRPDSGDPIDIICGNTVIEDLTNNKYCKDIRDCQQWMKDGLLEEVSNKTPHGECGDDEVEGVFKFQGKHYKITVEMEWSRYDKQYYYMDGSKITSCEEIELTPQQKGVVEILWDIFGGTITDKGYKQLDSHIGAIYGDAITLERCDKICKKLIDKGFASTNMVFGIGSYTYQYNTRDTFGFALKATHAIVNGVERMIFKDPITDDGTKKSLKGMAVVVDNFGKLECIDELSIEQREEYKNSDLLEDIFIDGQLLVDDSLSCIRKRVLSNI
jgi:nicotinamide phosphoribosyltransferase